MLYSVRDFFTEVAKTNGNTAFFIVGRSGESGFTGQGKIFSAEFRFTPLIFLYYRGSNLSSALSDYHPICVGRTRGLRILKKYFHFAEK